MSSVGGTMSATLTVLLGLSLVGSAGVQAMSGLHVSSTKDVPLTMEAAVGTTWTAKGQVQTDAAMNTLRGSLGTLQAKVNTLSEFGKQVPPAEKAVNDFYDMAVAATNRLQKSIGLPPGPPSLWDPAPAPSLGFPMNLAPAPAPAGAPGVSAPGAAPAPAGAPGAPGAPAAPAAPAALGALGADVPPTYVVDAVVTPR